MAKVKAASSTSSSSMMRPALSPEARENQLISLAYDRAEQQLRDGTASSQVISHFLKQGTLKTQLELEKIRNENLLLEAKTKAIENAEVSRKIAEDAIKAMRNYQGHGDPSEYEY